MPRFINQLTLWNISYLCNIWSRSTMTDYGFFNSRGRTRSLLLYSCTENKLLLLLISCLTRITQLFHLPISNFNSNLNLHCSGESQRFGNDRTFWIDLNSQIFINMHTPHKLKKWRWNWNSHVFNADAI